MRHHNANRKLGRQTDTRRALMRSLAEALFSKGQIKTTDAKARELRSFAEKLITRAKINTVASRRAIISRLGTEKRTKVLLDKVAPKYLDRPGGYTRIIKLPNRNTDGSKMAIIELV